MGRESLLEAVARGLRASRDRTGGERDAAIIRDLAVEGLQAAERLRSLLIEADSAISHLRHRGTWPLDNFETDRLIGRLRREDGSV